MTTLLQSKLSRSALLVVAGLAAGSAASHAFAGGAGKADEAGSASVSGPADPRGAEIANAGAGGVPTAQIERLPAVREIAFTDLQGRAHTLAETRGRVTLLEFWASWCVPCRKGFPFLEELQAKYAVDGLAVIALTLEEDGEAVQDFVEDHPSRFLIGRDPTGRAGEVFEVGAIPTAFLLDREGKILARFEGGTDSVHQGIEDAVGAVVSGEALDPALAAAAGAARTNALAWQREYLADPIMNLDGDVLSRSMREHVHASKEGAAGNGGVAGGGCGCN